MVEANPRAVPMRQCDARDLRVAGLSAAGAQLVRASKV